MNRPNWNQSVLYQGILSRFTADGAPLTDRERRILRDQLVSVPDSIRTMRPWMRTVVVCHKHVLGSAFTWADTEQGDDYWRGVNSAITRPHVIR